MRNPIEFAIDARTATAITHELGKRSCLFAAAVIKIAIANGKKYLGWMSSPISERDFCKTTSIVAHKTKIEAPTASRVVGFDFWIENISRSKKA